MANVSSRSPRTYVEHGTRARSRRLEHVLSVWVQLASILLSARLMQDIIKKHLDDLAAGNWEGYRSALAPDVVYEESATQQRVQGPDAYVAIVKRWKSAFPDLKATVRDIAASGNRVVAEVTWEGTHRGALEAGFGVIPPTNKFGKIAAVLVMKVDGGKIRESHHYFDLFSLMTQLGLAPNISGASAPGAAKPAQAAKRP